MEPVRKAFQRHCSFTDAEWAEFAERWEPISVRRNDHLCREGDMETHLYFSLKGIQRLYYIDNEGNDRNLGFAFNSFSGVYDSFAFRYPAWTSLQALTASELVGLNYDNYTWAFERFPQLEKWGRLFHLELLVGRGQRELELLTLSAEERFEQFMDRIPKELLAVPQKHLASYLNMTPETFSRMRARVRNS